MKRYIAILEIEDEEEIIDASVTYSYIYNGMNYKATERMKLKEESEGKMDIELVIKISEKTVNDIKDNAMFAKPIADHIKWDVTSAIVNGTPLPKGHGKIGDLDELIKAMKERNDDNGGEPFNAVDRGYDLAYQHMVKEAKECVIIETDKETDDYYRGAQEEY